MRLLFLTQQFDVKADSNLVLLTLACLDRGFEVIWGSIDHLSLNSGGINAMGFVANASTLSSPLPQQWATFDCREFNLIWLLSLGKRQSFLDKIQLLRLVERDVRVINSTNALLHLRSKYGLTQQSTLFQHPETHASNQLAPLAEVIARGGQWILKPPAGSMGSQVFLLDRETSNYRDILRHMLGLHEDQYLLLQAYLPEITSGEKRVLMAGGEIMGCYLRLPAEDHRTNLAQGAQAERATLSHQEIALAHTIGAFCQTEGAEFIGIDMVYPYIIEINIVNPGGLGTLQGLGIDLPADRLIQQIIPG